MSVLKATRMQSLIFIKMWILGIFGWRQRNEDFKEILSSAKDSEDVDRLLFRKLY